MEGVEWMFRDKEGKAEEESKEGEGEGGGDKEG